MGGALSSIVSVAAPVVGAVFGGPVGGAIGGAIGSAVSGGNPITGAITGGLGGLAAGALGGATGGISSAATDAVNQAAAAGIALDPAVAQMFISNGATAADAAMAAAGMTAADQAAILAAQSGAGFSLSQLSQGAQNFLQSTPQGQNILGPLLSAGASIAGGVAANNSAQNAANLTYQASNNALAQQAAQFATGQKNQAPYLAAGNTALGAQLDLMGLPGGTTGTPTNALTALTTSPGYQFQLDQGQRSLDAGLAARGGMGSGASAAAGVNYNQGVAQNSYNNRLSQLAGLTNMGQNTSVGMAQQGANYANTAGTTGINAAVNAGNAGMAGSNALTAGLVGAGTALNNYLNPAQATASSITGK